MAITKSYRKGEIIYEEGALQNWFYLISWGHVALYKDYNGDHRLLSTLGEGEFLGEMGMMEAKPRSVTAVAQDDVRLVVITEESFESDMADYPLKVHALLQTVSSRIREVTKDYIEACNTVAAYVGVTEKGQAVDEALMQKMQRIAAVGQKEEY